MDAGDFAELKRVEHDADVAVVGEPEAVILKRGLVAVAAAVGVAADVDDGRQRFTFSALHPSADTGWP